jgi:hypothetical protein
MAQVPANERCSTAATENSLPHSSRASVNIAWWGGERKCYCNDNIREDWVQVLTPYLQFFILYSALIKILIETFSEFWFATCVTFYEKLTFCYK